MLVLPLLLAWGARFGVPEPPARSSEALAAALEQLSAAAVAAEDLHWQPSAGLLADAVWGRSLVFLGRPYGQAGNDVWQAWVRLTPAGQPIAVGPANNWTRSPLSDERGLDVLGSHIAYAAVHEGQLHGVSLLPFHSRDPWWLLSSSWRTRFATYVYLPPTEQLSLLLEDAALRLELPSVARRLAIPLLGSAENAEGVAWSIEGIQRSVEVWTAPSRAEPRQQEWVGALSAWSRAFFGAGRQARQRTQALEVTPEHKIVNQTHRSPSAHPRWPPPDLEPLLPGGPAGEGAWAVVSPGVAGAAFYQTFIRSDADSQGNPVRLVAMDLTRLELAMAAGWSVPRSHTGLPGRGRLPAPARERVVAVFNGAGAEQGLGMQVSRRLLAKARSGAPTIVVHEDSRVGIGAWPGPDETPPAAWSSFRQAKVMLLDAARGQPPLTSEGEPRERSALCLARGVLVYAWGTQLTELAMARALQAAGCQDAVELDQGSGHASFSMTESTPERIQVAPLLGAPRPYFTGSERDFFYLMHRQPERKHGLPDASELEWSASPGPQPAPAEVPAVYAAVQRRGELRIALLGLDPLRVRYDVTAGSSEPLIAGQAAPRRRLAADDVLLAVELGHTTRALRYGLWVDRRRAIPLSTSFASLWIDGAGRLFVGEPATSAPPTAQSVIQVPLLVNGGELTERARSSGARRERGALCARATGHVLIASVTHDSSGPLALALRELGCQRVVELDRGSKHALRLIRRADARADAEATRLYLLGRASPVTTFALSDDAAR